MVGFTEKHLLLAFKMLNNLGFKLVLILHTSINSMAFFVTVELCVRIVTIH